MKYEKFENNGPDGKFVDKKELLEKRVTKAKIINEVIPYPSRFKRKDGSSQTQDIGSVQFQGFAEPFNVNINIATRNALIEAFGDDSKDWIGKVLTVNVLEGTNGYSLYLIPEGFKRERDDRGYVIIVREGQEEEIPTINVEEKEIKIEDIPF